jgi:hypothetical protein
VKKSLRWRGKTVGSVIGEQLKKIIKVVRRTIMQNLDLRGDYNLRLGAKGVAVLLMQKFVMAHAIICGGCKVSPPMPGLQFRIERNEAAKV